MVDKYEIRLRCNDESVVVTVHSDGILELDGYDESYDQAAQEFGYERSACGDLVRLWQDDTLSSDKVDALYLFLMPTVDHAIRFTTETVQYAMQMLPNYGSMAPQLVALQYAKGNAEIVVSEILEAIELKRSGKLTHAPINQPNVHSRLFYLLEKMEDEFLDWSSRNRPQLDQLRSDEYDSSRPATISSLEAVGHLCRGAKFIDELDRGGHEMEDMILTELFNSANGALWSITFSKNKRRGSDFRDTVDWFIGRFVKFMEGHP